MTEDISLYGKYEPINMSRSIRLYVESTNTWWYNSEANTAISYWKSGVDPVYVTMRREIGNLHSIILDNASYTHIKLYQTDPISGSAWVTTGDIPVNLIAFDVIKFSGPLNGGWTGPLTATDFSNTAPDISYLKTEVPLLTCSNYSQSGDLLSAYNRLGDNELEIIDALTVKSHDNIDLTYVDVINYYNGYRLSLAPQSPFNPETILASDKDLSILYFALAFGSLATFFYILLKRKKSLA